MEPVTAETEMFESESVWWWPHVSGSIQFCHSRPRNEPVLVNFQSKLVLLRESLHLDTEVLRYSAWVSIKL